MRVKEPVLKERIYLFDNIKLLAIILVVIGHAIDFIARQDGNHLEKSLFLIIYSVHMPLFIFISGLFTKPMDKETKFPKQKVISYVLIGIAIRIMMALLSIILNEDFKYSVLDMYDSFAWFMWAMAVFISIVWLFREYNTKILLLISLVIGCMSGFDKNLGDKLVLMRIVVFLPFFIIGYMIKPEQILRLISKKWLKIISVLFVVGILLLFIFYTDTYKLFRSMFTGRNNFSYLGEYYNFGFIVRGMTYAVSALFGFSLLCLVPNKNLGFLSGVGTKTLQIYFWHKAFLFVLEHFDVYNRISGLTGETLATLIYILIAVLIAFICALPLFSFPTKQLISFGKNKK